MAAQYIHKFSRQNKSNDIAVGVVSRFRALIPVNKGPVIERIDTYKLATECQKSVIEIK